ncbi:MAG TPA: hypothetical protein VFQ39_11900 [Longimicrobium sp.]|nr:hypothetical protein [Longimicrobium sp.]
MSNPLRRLVLAASCAAMAFALPATLRSETASSGPCETTCLRRRDICLASGLSSAACQTQYEGCMTICNGGSGGGSL